MIHLVTGGARSGKSRYAEDQVRELLRREPERTVCYIATATAGDEEMKERIDHHRSTRPKDWVTLEEPLYLSRLAEVRKSGILLVDCMTLWLSNWLCDHGAEAWQDEKKRFLTLLQSDSREWVIVTNEVGSGIVPLGALNRQFADEAGWLNQSLAALADRVTLVVSGCPLSLKSLA